MQLRTRSEGNDEGRTNMRAVSMIHGCIGNDLTSGQPNGLQQPLLMRQGMCVYVKGRFLC